MSRIVKKKFKIKGLNCSACCLNIDIDLEELEGIIKVKTSYAREECEVEFDEQKINIKEILEQIKKTGYTATEI